MTSQLPAPRFPWAQALRLCRAALLLGMTACALVGTLSAPAYVVLAVAPACGSFVAVLVALNLPDVATAWGYRAAVLAGAWTALLVPALAGVRALGNSGGWVALGLVVLAGVVGAGWLAPTGEPTPQRPATGWEQRAGRDVDELRRLVQVLPTPMLLHEWRSAGRPDTDDAPGHPEDAADVRALVLEELSRRDPAGVRRWLSAGPAEAPERHLRDDPTASS